MKDYYKEGMRELEEALHNGEKFVLFVGAGQNAGFNMRLLWNDLIRDACELSFRQLFQQMGLSHPDTNAILQCMDILKKDKTVKTKGNHESDSSDPKVCHNANIVDTERDSSKKDNTGENNTKQEDTEKIITDYIRSNFPVEIQVSIIKDLLKDHYVPLLQHHLYNECNYDVIKKAFSLYSPLSRFKNPPFDFEHYDKADGKVHTQDDKELFTLFVIARLILLNRRIESVITYNFDNFIRQAVKILLSSPTDFFQPEEIEYIKRRFQGKSHSKDQTNTGTTSLADLVHVIDVHDNTLYDAPYVKTHTFPVYHVHGYIPDPAEEEIVDNPEIVLALEDFIHQQTDGLSWQDAVQIKAFRDSNIIFIGCSMTDLTMKRMINYAHAHGCKNKIFILSASKPYKKPESSRRINALNELRAWYYESLGAKFINCPDNYKGLCEKLYMITDKRY